jgi:hypothetical protein
MDWCGFDGDIYLEDAGGGETTGGECAEGAAVNHQRELSGGKQGFGEIIKKCTMPGIRNRIIIAVLLMLLQILTRSVLFVFPPHVLVPSLFCSV